MPKMLSPFIFKNGKNEVILNDKLINWVYDNKYDSDTSKENIREEYDKFIKSYNI